ncbi:sushi, von Willebrand factor type A, EGF and pentraxin domain-containing protein 1-like [Pecten maximus]|uniref:sushi, von Willebrand factor type A, EGF and pentraxin domain-containing protein 1-like n=1 Tax=Pecten maximus TaxID=6579 RepID=UPI00145834C1|nr:sushi, von Willebrand factor type A, EGF and pentraxin domain-containing protein 1-like [Pecten maximus]
MMSEEGSHHIVLSDSLRRKQQTLASKPYLRSKQPTLTSENHMRNSIQMSYINSKSRRTGILLRNKWRRQKFREFTDHRHKQSMRGNQWRRKWSVVPTDNSVRGKTDNSIRGNVKPVTAVNLVRNPGNVKRIPTLNLMNNQRKDDPLLAVNIVRRRRSPGPYTAVTMTRERRSLVSHPAVNMVWSADIPICRDTERPTFRDCPQSPVFVSLPPGSPIPVNITVPSAYDNSNSSVTITYNPPDFRTPYIFRKNTTVIVTAQDSSANEAQCRFQVILKDTFPPTIECPRSVVIEKYYTNQTTVPIYYHRNNYVTSTGDIAQHTYHPQEGSAVSIRTHIQVTVTVYDNSGNTASCNFSYEAQRHESFPIYQLDFSVNLLPSNSKTSSVCDVSSQLKMRVLEVITSNCSAILPQMFRMEVKSVLINQGVANITAQIWRQPTSVTATPEKMSQCATYATNALNILNNEVLSSSSCGDVRLSYSNKSLQQGFTCPNYSVFTATQRCSQCVLGTFPNTNTSQCEPCPKVSEDGPARHPYCRLCSQDTQDDGHCLADCKPGEFSNTGLQPCIKCTKGSYSVNNASTSCTACPGMSSSTVNTGSSSPSDCKEECPMGAYSLTGLKPCIHCPYHFYSDRTRSTSCTECQSGTGTTSTGGTSRTQCIVLNPCDQHVCRNNGTCMSLDQGRFHRCSCLHGFTGKSCEDQMNVCHSYPCMNGATCQSTNSLNICICRPGFTGFYCETDIDECESNPCQHGNCIDKVDGFSCACYPGYKGVRCATQVNECDSQPCMNGGTCVDMIGEYRCYCNGTGYQGRRCNTTVIDCLPDTCLNLGMCHDFNDEFKCSCLPGFTGSQCEMSRDKCESTPCQNEALCLDGINNYSCICQRGYTGTHCETNIDECQSFSCRNGGTCIDRIDNFDCTCATGYAGKTCAVNIDDCLSSPCQENNTVKCEDLVAGFFCVCKPGWTGVHCETLLEECTSHPCQNGATCRDVDVDYICSCPKGFTGLDCQVDVDDCASGPCYNSGTCIDGVNSYTCTCPHGFTGARCDSLLDLCSSSPCHNSGTCVSLLGNYSCSCKWGWTGLNCENGVDDCLSMPCHNGGTCQDKHLGYDCTCTHDLTGPQCDVAVDPCDSLACENGGSCVIEGNQIMCVCPPMYKGEVCGDKLDTCEVTNPCQNGATCSSHGCQCQPLYTGKHCDKLMTKDFDLVFPGQPGSIVQSPVVSPQQTSQLSICLWVHFRNKTANMTFLSLHSEDGLELLAMLGDKLVLSFSSPLTINWMVNDKLWHHVAFTWSDSGHWSVYVDGQIINEGTSYSQQVAMPNRQSIVLGQRSVSLTARNPFEGEISQVNVYSKALSQTAIQAMANNCTTSQELGDRHQWPEFSSYLRGNVSVIMPTICGASTCPPGMKGPRCDLLIDKNPPVVHNCTDNIMIVSNQRLNKVDWQEPGFSDNIGVKNITKTHRPGITLSYGQYRVHYTAFDEEGNFAICTFDIFIKPQDCVMPVSPTNVQMEWMSWEKGLSFHIACQDSLLQTFPVPVPTWYTCGIEGFWDPPQGTDFTLPSCAGVTSASGSLTGEMKFSGPACTETSLQSLKKDTLDVFLNMYQSLCPSSNCSAVSIHVDCGGLGVKRRKRQADNTYSVVFDLSVNGSSLGSSGNAGNLIFETMVKEGSFDTTDFVLDKNNASIKSAIQCEEMGQVLTPDNLCVNCAVGTYQNGNTCELCPIGQYSDSEKQTSCENCQTGTTTLTQGTTHSSHCFTMCSVGQFYSKETLGCNDCSLGYYQDEVGQVTCKSCPNGQMTTDKGAESLDFCTGMYLYM